jgi:anti-sigma B factor antagonist
MQRFPATMCRHCDILMNSCLNVRKSPTQALGPDFNVYKRKAPMHDQTTTQTPPHKTTPPLTLQIERTGNAVVVRCHGKLISGVNDILYSQVRELMPDDKRIVLDLTELIHVDSTGLGTLVRLYVHSRSTGCSLELINLGPKVRQLLGMTNLLSVFTVIGEHHIKIG